ncbi:protein of unknown function [Nitrosotalea devaniterrae]|uniref:Uncharacterized protein n=1 Tax=Nitrosotalea devaniterrae TaxID=1078905 RepID=A0A128A3K4_9ARCH|nr:protein of unknown function [Candidatus Nitrosotalea devanaterra]
MPFSIIISTFELRQTLQRPRITHFTIILNLNFNEYQLGQTIDHSQHGMTYHILI